MIRVGVGGWVIKPWRGTFYPPDLPQARELEYASRRLTTIEINSTFYRTQSRKSFRKWAGETPDDFVFSVKAPRAATHRRVLAEAGESIERFFASGVLELGRKLGPILWQLHPAKKFQADDCARFLELLPRHVEGHAMQHVLEARHASFVDRVFADLARAHAVALALIDSEKQALMADVTGDIVYARLQRASAKAETGYPRPQLETWARRARLWADGSAPDDLPTIAGASPSKKKRDVFIYMIAGEKTRDPAAAMALLDLLQ